MSTQRDLEEKAFIKKLVHQNNYGGAPDPFPFEGLNNMTKPDHTHAPADYELGLRLLHVTHSATGIPHVANPRMRGAVIDYKATLNDLAAQHLELKSAMSGDVRRGDKLYALLAEVERTWVFQFLPRVLKNAIADSME